jgi:hypothetical protein
MINEEIKQYLELVGADPAGLDVLKPVFYIIGVGLLLCIIIVPLCLIFG